jgi:parallel beta-helix repeat protein
MLVVMLLLGLFVAAFRIQPVKSSGTIYIRTDGSIDPSGSPISTVDNVTYTFFGNITDSIVVERDNIAVNGAGYTVQGTGSGYGFFLYNTDSVTIRNTNIVNFEYGILLQTSPNSTISRNNLTTNSIGIYLYMTSSNNVSGNNIKNNSVGIELGLSSNNFIHHNNFVDNANQFFIPTSGLPNIWDDGYPSGGNYWSDYSGIDSCSGLYQNVTGSDGIGDSQYIIDTENADHYPLIHAWNTTFSEMDVVSRINGSRAYNFDLALESIAYSNYAFRAGGSAGANETANWIKAKFESSGLETWLEPFEFAAWDLLEKPALVIDNDGNQSSSNDQFNISSIQPLPLSWPTPESGIFADLVVLPLPSAADRNELGTKPINVTEWNFIDTAGKIVLIGNEVDWCQGGSSTFLNKIIAQPPAAIIKTWWFDWMAFVPDFFSSASGRPLGPPIYWNLNTPIASVSHEDGVWINSRENMLNVSAKLSIKSTIGNGTSYNVVGRIGGYANPEKTVIVSSHYDTVMCSGFCDNGAGTAGVVELAGVFAEAVKSGVYKPCYTLLFVAFADEEYSLVGSIEYVKQHKNETANIIAVINLDCIGSDQLRVTDTNEADDLDLDQVTAAAAHELGLDIGWVYARGADHNSFQDPSWVDGRHLYRWGIEAGISDAVPVESSLTIISYPLLYSDKWDMGIPGWIHSSFDNSTSTQTLMWVEPEDLENHIKVSALAVLRVSTDTHSVDVAVTDTTPSKTVVGQGQTMQLNITLENQGNHTETPIVTIYANSTAITTFADITLMEGESKNTTLTWDTTGFPYGDYTIRVKARITPTEIDTLDNEFSNGVTYVGISGDINADGIVEMMDFYAASQAYLSTPEKPNWNPSADINNDHIVEMMDFFIMSQHYLEHT